MTDQKPPKETVVQTEAPVQKVHIEDAEIERVCRPPALRFSKEMVELANKKFEGYAPFWCPLIAAHTLQNILILCMLEQQLDPGGEEGLKTINSFFDKCKFEVARHWRNPALKQGVAKKKSSIISLAPEA